MKKWQMTGLDTGSLSLVIATARFAQRVMSLAGPSGTDDSRPATSRRTHSLLPSRAAVRQIPECGAAKRLACASFRAASAARILACALLLCAAPVHADAQERPYCTIDAGRYYRCQSLAETEVNGSPAKVYVEIGWFAGHCRPTSKGDRNVGVFARCDDLAPALTEGLPTSALARVPERPSLGARLKRKLLYVVGTIVTVIYIVSRAQ